MAQEQIVTISPTTNRPLLERTPPTKLELQHIISRSQLAFQSFSKNHSLEDRQQIIERFLVVLDQRKDEFARELTEQMGRPISYTSGEITTAIRRARYLLKISDEVLADTPGESEQGFKRYIRKIPVGPALIIFAWNYPYLILVNSLIPAILAGNTVILKPSPQTPTIAEHFQSIFLEVGLPQDVITFFHSGTPLLTRLAVQSPLVKLICFTGSVKGGLEVQAASYDRIASIGLELGGKDGAYVREDVDVKWAAAEIVDGAIFNSGQSCCSVERVYVHASIYEAFVSATQEVLSAYKLGDPFDPITQIGPVISKNSQKTIQEHIDQAIQDGAVDSTPANSTFSNPPPDGNFIRPTLLTNVNHGMRVMKEETFGPVIPVMKVEDDEEAIRLMNDSEFGLTGSIWTKDLEKGEELAQLIEAGTVFVNRCDFPSPDLAWTGYKNSGRGVTLSKFGFDQFVKLKSIHLKSYPK